MLIQQGGKIRSRREEGRDEDEPGGYGALSLVHEVELHAQLLRALYLRRRAGRESQTRHASGQQRKDGRGGVNG